MELQQKQDHLNFIHCVFQELEDMGVDLPMGDYNLMYDMIERIRDEEDN